MGPARLGHDDEGAPDEQAGHEVRPVVYPTIDELIKGPVSSPQDVPSRWLGTSPGSPGAGEVVPDAAPDEEVAPAVRWVSPGPAETAVVSEGPYRGRLIVGEPGAMLRVVPTVRSRSGTSVPDSVVDAAVIGDEVSVGAVSVRGASHHQAGTPRQDAYAIAENDDWVVIVIADGVSQGRLSHAAAARAASTTASDVIDRLAEHGGPGAVDWVAVAERSRTEVRNLGLLRARQTTANGARATPTDREIAALLATTCDVVVTPTRRSAGALIVTRVRIAGDGSFYVLDPERGWTTVGPAKSSGGSVVDNAVNPLPVETAHPVVDEWDLAPGQVAVLCTDGFGDVIGDGGRPVGRYLATAWAAPIDTTGLLQSASFININADDDRTAALIWATA